MLQVLMPLVYRLLNEREIRRVVKVVLIPGLIATVGQVSADLLRFIQKRPEVMRRTVRETPDTSHPETFDTKLAARWALTPC
jgi:hypothetical protein